jgi:hypothetical protein
MFILKKQKHTTILHIYKININITNLLIQDTSRVLYQNNWEVILLYLIIK